MKLLPLRYIYTVIVGRRSALRTLEPAALSPEQCIHSDAQVIVVKDRKATVNVFFQSGSSAENGLK